MGKLIDNLQKSLNVTKTEITVVFVLISGLIIGLILKEFVYKNENEYDKIANEVYKSIDSLADAQNTEPIDSLKNKVSNSEVAQSNIEENVPKEESSKEKADLTKKINIKSASKSQLMNLPGIGEKTAEKIIEYRTSYGFINIEDIMKVKGIGVKKFEKIKELIEVK